MCDAQRRRGRALNLQPSPAHFSSFSFAIYIDDVYVWEAPGGIPITIFCTLTLYTQTGETTPSPSLYNVGIEEGATLLFSFFFRNINRVIIIIFFFFFKPAISYSFFLLATVSDRCTVYRSQFKVKFFFFFLFHSLMNKHIFFFLPFFGRELDNILDKSR